MREREIYRDGMLRLRVAVIRLRQLLLPDRGHFEFFGKLRRIDRIRLTLITPTLEYHALIEGKSLIVAINRNRERCVLHTGVVGICYLGVAALIIATLPPGVKPAAVCIKGDRRSLLRLAAFGQFDQQDARLFPALLNDDAHQLVLRDFHKGNQTRIIAVDINICVERCLDLDIKAAGYLGFVDSLPFLQFQFLTINCDRGRHL